MVISVNLLILFLILYQAEARAEFAERSVQKLQKEVDRLEGKICITPWLFLKTFNIGLMLHKCTWNNSISPETIHFCNIIHIVIYNINIFRNEKLHSKHYTNDVFEIKPDWNSIKVQSHSSKTTISSYAYCVYLVSGLEFRLSFESGFLLWTYEQLFRTFDENSIW